MTSTHHDLLFKHFLSRPDNARKFLPLSLPPEKRALCDLSTLELQKDSLFPVACDGLRSRLRGVLTAK